MRKAARTSWGFADTRTLRTSHGAVGSVQARLCAICLRRQMSPCNFFCFFWSRGPRNGFCGGHVDKTPFITSVCSRAAAIATPVMARRLAALMASAVLCTLPVATGFSFSAAVPGALGAAPARLALTAGAQRPPSCAVAQLAMSGRRMRVAPRHAPGGSTAKRAGRLGKLVMTELVGILRSPYLLKVSGGDVDAELASLISIVEVDMSGDNKVAKVLVSAMGSDIEKKKAVQWLNKNAKAIRFSLAQKISHLKTVPELRFSASALPQAMEVMSILDQLRVEREARESRAAAAEPQVQGAEEEGEQEVLRGIESLVRSEEDTAMFAAGSAMSPETSRP